MLAWLLAAGACAEPEVSSVAGELSSSRVIFSNFFDARTLIENSDAASPPPPVPPIFADAGAPVVADAGAIVHADAGVWLPPLPVPPADGGMGYRGRGDQAIHRPPDDENPDLAGTYGTSFAYENEPGEPLDISGEPGEGLPSGGGEGIEDSGWSEDVDVQSSLLGEKTPQPMPIDADASLKNPISVTTPKDPPKVVLGDCVMTADDYRATVKAFGTELSAAPAEITVDQKDSIKYTKDVSGSVSLEFAGGELLKKYIDAKIAEAGKLTFTASVSTSATWNAKLTMEPETINIKVCDGNQVKEVPLKIAFVRVKTLTITAVSEQTSTTIKSAQVKASLGVSPTVYGVVDVAIKGEAGAEYKAEETHTFSTSFNKVVNDDTAKALLANLHQQFIASVATSRPLPGPVEMYKRYMNDYLRPRLQKEMETATTLIVQGGGELKLKALISSPKGPYTCQITGSGTAKGWAATGTKCTKSGEKWDVDAQGNATAFTWTPYSYNYKTPEKAVLDTTLAAALDGCQYKKKAEERNPLVDAAMSRVVTTANAYTGNTRIMEYMPGWPGTWYSCPFNKAIWPWNSDYNECDGPHQEDKHAGTLAEVGALKVKTPDAYSTAIAATATHPVYLPQRSIHEENTLLVGQMWNPTISGGWVIIGTEFAKSQFSYKLVKE